MSGTIPQQVLDRISQPLTEVLAPGISRAAERLQRKGLCESPIEIMLGASLLLVDGIIQLIPDNPLILASQNEIEKLTDDRLLVPQYEWRDRRIDFAILQGSQVIFIECDGHDFHERTPQQAVRDRRKDREAQQDGHTILRFPGSEIYADPVRCAIEVFETSFALLKKEARV